MRHEILQKMKEALQVIDEELDLSLRHSKIPSFCAFLHSSHAKIKHNKDLSQSRIASVAIELSVEELRVEKDIVYLIKRKMYDPRLNLKEENIIVDKSEINVIKYIEFDKKGSDFRMQHGHLIGNDSYYVYVTIYFLTEA